MPAVPQFSLLAVSLVQPLFRARYVPFSMLGLALLIGAALSAVARLAGPRFPRAWSWVVPTTTARQHSKHTSARIAHDLLSDGIIAYRTKESTSGCHEISIARSPIGAGDLLACCPGLVRRSGAPPDAVRGEPTRTPESASPPAATSVSPKLKASSTSLLVDHGAQ
ncbi:hypothetical protein GCM10009787_60950 [Streptomyces bangladeshensis]|uniref:Uncharacterized protein n=1 Tax=Streptomyces bangladeshensis TaxID=295352 RepID=A0ABP5NVR1_9ACTN